MLMRCWITRRHLSAYYDGELAPAAAAQVRDHVRACERCRAALTAIEGAGHHLATLPPPKPPAMPWRAIVAKARDDAGVRQSRTDAWRLAWRWAPLVAIPGGLALLVVYLLTPPQMEHREMAGGSFAFDLGPYLEAVAQASSRDAAAFERRYDARPTSLAEAAARAGFDLIAPRTLPDSWQLDGVRLLKDACCHVVQLTYRRDADHLALFQQPADHPLICSRGGLWEGRVNGFRYHRAHENGAALVTWTGDMHRFALVAERPESELVATAQWLTSVAATQAGASADTERR